MKKFVKNFVRRLELSINYMTQVYNALNLNRGNTEEMIGVRLIFNGNYKSILVKN